MKVCLNVRMTWKWDVDSKFTESKIFHSISLLKYIFISILYVLQLRNHLLNDLVIIYKAWLSGYHNHLHFIWEQTAFS